MIGGELHRLESLEWPDRRSSGSLFHFVHSTEKGRVLNTLITLTTDLVRRLPPALSFRHHRQARHCRPPSSTFTEALFTIKLPEACVPIKPPQSLAISANHPALIRRTLPAKSSRGPTPNLRHHCPSPSPQSQNSTDRLTKSSDAAFTSHNANDITDGWNAPLR